MYIYTVRIGLAIFLNLKQLLRVFLITQRDSTCTRAHTCTYTHVSMYVCVYVCMYIIYTTCVCLCVCMRVCVCVCVNVYACVRACVHTCVHSYVRARVCIGGPKYTYFTRLFLVNRNTTLCCCKKKCLIQIIASANDWTHTIILCVVSTCSLLWVILRRYFYIVTFLIIFLTCTFDEKFENRNCLYPSCRILNCPWIKHNIYQL